MQHSKLLVFLLIVCLFSTKAQAETQLRGAARAIDGDTLEISGHRVRLAGIDAPEKRQDCRRADGSRWACGAAVRDRVAAMVATARVSCRISGRDRYGRGLGVCYAGRRNIARALAVDGWAVVDPRFHSSYWPQARAAQSTRTGLWAGGFDWPWIYRHRGRK